MLLSVIFFFWNTSHCGILSIVIGIMIFAAVAIVQRVLFLPDVYIRILCDSVQHVHLDGYTRNIFVSYRLNSLHRYFWGKQLLLWYFAVKASMLVFFVIRVTLQIIFIGIFQIRNYPYICILIKTSMRIFFVMLKMFWSLYLPNFLSCGSSSVIIFYGRSFELKFTCLDCSHSLFHTYCFVHIS